VKVSDKAADSGPARRADLEDTGPAGCAECQAVRVLDDGLE
jgi:hypothetical protein